MRYSPLQCATLPYSTLLLATLRYSSLPSALSSLLLPLVTAQPATHPLHSPTLALTAITLSSGISPQVQDIAFSDLLDNPLYHHDVEKMDQQDNNAATHLFSAATLNFIREHHPDKIGLMVYLFVMGEVIDAYQSHTISHLERVRMVLWC